VEYIELYNRSDNTFNLKDWTLNSGTQSSVLPDYVLAPGEYVVFAEDSAMLWDSLGNVVIPASWIGLVNGGDDISIRSAGGVSVDLVQYAIEWYRDGTKALGGFSLERIDADPITCPDIANWIASEAATGGTPGSVNSVAGLADLDEPTALISLQMIASDTLALCFNESMDAASLEELSHYTFTPDLGINAAAPVGPDFTCVKLVIDAPLEAGILYELRVTQVSDCKGTVIPAALTQSILQSLPPNPGEVIINELMADPTPSQGLPEAEYIELFNNSEQTFNLQGWTLSSGNTVGMLPNYILHPNAYVIITRAEDTVALNILGDVLSPSSWPSLSNQGDELGLRSMTGILVDTVAYTIAWYQDADKSDGGFSLERISPDATSCPDIANWRASEDEQGGTPGFENSVFSVDGDQTAPEIQGIQVLAADSIRVCFSESMDPASLSIIANYTLAPSIAISTANPIGPEFVYVDIKLADTLSQTLMYMLTVSGVSDCAGNQLESPVQLSVTLGQSAARGDVIINEIMADPTPAIGLPEAEYLELHNPSDKRINLEGWQLSNGSTVGVLPNYILNAGRYVILVARADSGAFAGLGDIVVPNAWPGLVNSSDDLGLRNAANELIDIVSYDISWYGDPDKDNGGYSLERINPNPSDCPAITNWQASNDLRGGSPGIQNSVYSLETESEPPLLESLSVVTSDTLLVCFNESMEVDFLAAAENFELDNGIEILSTIPQSPDLRCVRLILSAQLTADLTYTLTIRDATDCKGNVNANTLTTTIVLGGNPVANDVIINEILPDPTLAIGLPEAEYVELFNRSEKTFNLGGWTLSNGSTVGELPAFVLAPGAYVLLVPEDDRGGFAGIEPVISPSTWPSLVNRGDNLGLRSNTGVLVDTLTYDISWYDDATKDDGGYSLERINPEELDCPSAANWTASNAPDGGTPAAQNSVFSDLPDTNPPEIVDTEVISPDSLLLCFNETMDPASLAQLANYRWDIGIEIVSAAPQFPNVECVLLVLGDTLARGNSYELVVDGVTDCKGNSIEGPVGVPIVLGVAAQAFEVIITEIYTDFSPRVALPEAEYVEIFNPTKKILDISGWGIQDPGATGIWGALNIEPSESIILCDEEDVALFESFGRVVGLERFPSLGNTSDSLYLINELGFTMDYVFYSNDWYNNDVKADGGWSIERIDPTFVDCNNPGNWTASRDSRGGTPGEENSVGAIFTDTIPPRVTGVVIQDPVTISVFFNEQMDPATLQNPANYNIDPDIGQPILGFPIAPTYTQVLLLLNEAVDSTTIYNLSISGLRDCGGNEISAIEEFGLPSIIEAGDIKLNEILFNPYKGGTDFVEIVNVSDKVLDLKDLFIGEVDPLTGAFENTKQVATQTALLLPGAIVALTSDVGIQQTFYSPPDAAQFYQMESFPTYDDAEGIAVIFTTTDTLDMFSYEDDFHFPTLADDEGVSLERLALDRPTQDPGNWHSASGTVNFATPGYENSQLTEVEEPPSEVVLQEDTFSPNGDGQGDVLAINYDFDFIGANTRVSIFDVNGRLIRILQQNTLLDPGPGTLFWDGRDDLNQKADIGPYVILFEVTDQQTGEEKRFKLVTVLADQF